MKVKLLLSVFGLLLSLGACSQPTPQKDSIPDSLKQIRVDWQTLVPGLWLCETDAPFKSVVNDSRLTLLKLDPTLFSFDMRVATALDRKPHTVDEWANIGDYHIVFNAGMYDLAHKLISRGYLQHHDHHNNAKIHPTFNSMIGFTPKDSLKQAPFQVFDLQCTPWEQIRKKYRSWAQGLRMLDCDGNPIGWNKRRQSCSMLACAMDQQGMIYLIFTRSPYTHNEFIGFLRQMPFKLVNAIYLEGGPETSLFVRIGDTCIEKVGSYVSQTYENDLNDRFWALPNVIGLRYKGNIPPSSNPDQQ